MRQLSYLFQQSLDSNANIEIVIAEHQLPITTLNRLAQWERSSAISAKPYPASAPAAAPRLLHLGTATINLATTTDQARTRFREITDNLKTLETLKHSHRHIHVLRLYIFQTRERCWPGGPWGVANIMGAQAHSFFNQTAALGLSSFYLTHVLAREPVLDFLVNLERVGITWILAESVESNLQAIVRHISSRHIQKHTKLRSIGRRSHSSIDSSSNSRLQSNLHLFIRFKDTVLYT